MTTLHTSFVLGYHGCDKAIGESLINSISKPTLSEKDYDWLGPGFYVWEADPKRAWEWADDKKNRNSKVEPFVIGVVVDLGNCLDLTNREDLELLKGAYAGLKEINEKAGDPLPVNSWADENGQPRLWNLDCAVIKFLHKTIADQTNAKPYDTVRGLFQEGGALYPGSGFKSKNHTQIAICNTAAIKGIFSVPRS
ncbi:hypothetical protein [Acetobacter syzygii]|uniref:Uncharacterized protein n=1 Tax=Acetobacter syzygii TaxID=146476 RepID=A0A270B6G9_9PROT|nr:hypothetical protein [Acetobacter syzygii]NSL92720.1 hypothetical protein [Acetobacter syzygii]PAL20578.1 hypothetical protein B9K05_12820 [Acetobacter syzygii]PAL21189.1 hypothetical protein B9K04_12955 [Acetobacter syzygii]